jgi:hypothetical protein
MLFHSLYRDDGGSIKAGSFTDYDALSPNAIDEAFAGLVDREIQQSMRGMGR